MMHKSIIKLYALSHLLVLAASLSLVLHGVLHGSMGSQFGHPYIVVLFGAHKEETNSAIYEWLSNYAT